MDITEFVKPEKLSHLIIDDVMKLTKDLMVMIFTEKELATSSRTGNTSVNSPDSTTRERLDPVRVNAIYRYVYSKFPTENEKEFKKVKRDIGSAFGLKTRDVRKKYIPDEEDEKKNQRSWKCLKTVTLK